MPTTITAPSLRLLLARAVDYAGLFPPAALDMAEAVHNYAAYRAAPHEWMLGRFVVPVSRLDEFAVAAAELPAGSLPARPWPVAALLGEDHAADVSRALAFNDARGATAVIDVCEGKVNSVDELLTVAANLPPSFRCFVEIPLAASADAFAAAAADAGVGVKARTGGTTKDAFPSAEAVVLFLRAAVEHNVPFKLTAGLHHAVAGEYRLTYEPSAACGTMFGFLNVFLAAAMIAGGASDATATRVLSDGDSRSIEFLDDGARWRDVPVTAGHIRATRRLLSAFGSCSFMEPVEELQTLGLLA